MTWVLFGCVVVLIAAESWLLIWSIRLSRANRELLQSNAALLQSNVALWRAYDSLLERSATEGTR